MADRPTTFSIARFRGDDDRMSAARRIRNLVFCEEQGVPEALEWDGEDERCEHFLLADNDEPVATARVRPYGPSTFKIERVAVLGERRGTGVGKAIMVYILEDLRERDATVVLNAQTHVESFYSQLGFVRKGEVFEEAGIPHVRMVWQR